MRARGRGWTYGMGLDVLREGRVVFRWALKTPIRETVPHHPEYLHVLHLVITRFHVTSITVSSLIGHSLDVLDTGLATQIVVHDQFPHCSALSMFFENRPCSSCDSGRLKRCLDANPLQAQFAAAPRDHWLEVRDRYRAQVQQPWVQVLAPSRHAARQYSMLTGCEPHVVPHDPAFPHHPIDPGPITDGQPIRCVILGRLDQRKGRQILLEALGERQDMVQWYLLGCGSGLKHLKNRGVQIRPAYRRSQLHRLLQEFRPHVGALLSVLPESFSYTLSELRQCAVPPIATDIGSFTERIQDGRTGYLIQPNAGALVRRLISLHADPSSLTEIHRRLASEPSETGAMVSRYQAYLNQITAERVSVSGDSHFRPASPLLRLFRMPGAIKEGLEKKWRNG